MRFGADHDRQGGQDRAETDEDGPHGGPPAGQPRRLATGPSGHAGRHAQRLLQHGQVHLDHRRRRPCQRLDAGVRALRQLCLAGRLGLPMDGELRLEPGTVEGGTGLGRHRCQDRSLLGVRP
jgi:hypothetical protein